jgi:hypothetical protein
MRPAATAEVRLDEDNAARSGSATPSVSPSWLSPGRLLSNFVAAELPATEDHAQRVRNLENVEQIPYTMRARLRHSPNPCSSDKDKQRSA